MSYLKTRRSRIIIGAFISFALFAVLVPSADLVVARLFFNGVAFPDNAWWMQVQQEILGYFLCISLLAVLLIYAWNRLLRQQVLNVDGRKVLYLLLVLVLGAGLIVNVGLKNHFGRARPRDVAEFGGARQFTPAYMMSKECRTNCSFSSGDAAAGFFSIALAMAFRRRRIYFAIAVAFGVLHSVSRMASGAHFLSDTVTSFFIMLIVSDILFHYMIAVHEEQPLLTLSDGVLAIDVASSSAPRPMQLARRIVQP